MGSAGFSFGSSLIVVCAVDSVLYWSVDRMSLGKSYTRGCETGMPVSQWLVVHGQTI